jgi:cytochrome c peroxidase
MKRNSMALANSRYTAAWFSDMRAHGPDVTSLKDLVLHPLQAHDELGMTPELLVSKLSAAPFYPQLFANAFGTPEINIDRIGRGLGQFVQALISYRSRADQAFNSFDNGPGDPASVYNTRELRGLELFGGNCSICHEPNAHTNVWQSNNGLDATPTDPGITEQSINNGGSGGAFRAASLRNIAVSGPYMHDGRFATLREVIEHYDSGVKASPNLDSILRDSSGGARRLNLSDEDKASLEAYLLTLTDDAFLSDPKFSDPFP